MHDISRAFITARLNGDFLPDYPGALPETLSEAYDIQDGAIKHWDDTIAGWKVGGIPTHLQEKYGASRMAGPIFSKLVKHTYGLDTVVEMETYEGGFAAIEPEIILETNQDIKAGQVNTDTDDLAAYVAKAYTGIEIASSPLLTLNDLGPTSIISDFGNNAGIIIGEEIKDWTNVDLTTFPVSCDISHGTHAKVMASEAAHPLTVFAFLLNLFAQRGIDMPKGTFISTGAITGVHKSNIGDTSTVTFGDYTPINIKLVKAQPINAA